MKRKIFIFGVFVTMLFTLSIVNAQDFVRDSINLFPNGKKFGERMVIKRGETKKVIGNISVISEEQAKYHDKVKDWQKNGDYILEKLGNDMYKLINNEGKNIRLKDDDTLYIVADSISLEKFEEKQNNFENIVYTGVFIYNDNHSENKVNTYFINTLNNFVYSMSGIINNLEIDDNKYKSKNNCKNTKKRILSSSLVLGYGYLNFSDNGLFSTPSSSDFFSIKWSDKWDIMLRFTFLPDNKMSFITGIGFQSNVFRFDDGFAIGAFSYNPPPVAVFKEKFKLVARYITLPIFVSLKTGDHLKIHAGAIGGINYRNSHTGFKRSYTINGEKIEQSTGSKFKEFNTFKIDAMLGFEIYGWTFYASHSLTNMFKNSYIKKAMPFSFGVLIGL
ncbi:MAG: hypothetical protein ACTTJH_02175 [Bacteroidales bacterium]